MKTLSEFLAEHIIDERDYYNDDAAYQDMLKFFANKIAEGIEAYKKHLQKDSPKTVQWAMIERDLISALEKMQSHKHLNDKKHKLGCASYNNPPAEFASSVTDCDCKDLPNEKESDLGEIRHPICPLNMYFEGDEDKIDLSKCTWIVESRGCSEECKLKKEDNLGEIRYPICPLNMYFEGDENKIDLDKCDFENRGCTNACKYKYKCKHGHSFNDPCTIDSYGSTISPRCPKCNTNIFIEK